jgi:type IV pilus assembly protein PilA
MHMLRSRLGRLTRANKNSSDDGFSLIELMVVILIIAVLIAIAIPTFMGARKKSQDAQAKSHLRGALVAEKTYLSDKQLYTNDVAELSKLETSLQWGVSDAGARGVVVEDLSANELAVVLASKSRSGTLFCLADLHEPFDYSGEGYPTLTQSGTFYAKRDNAGSGECKGLVWEVTSSGWD